VAGLVPVLRFPLPILIHQMLHTHLSSGACTIGQLVIDIPSGLSVCQPHKIKKKLLIIRDCYVMRHTFEGIGVGVTLLTFIRQVLGSNVDRDIVYPESFFSP
jgi:hypothetical protein